MKTILIPCRFCEKTVVRLDFADKQIIDEEKLRKEYFDNRCSNHVIEHGDFKEMWIIYDRDVEVNYPNFLKVMEKCEYKLGKFAERMILDYPEKFLNREEDYQNFAQKKKEAQMKLGIDKLSYDKKLKKIAVLKAK